MFIYCTLNNCQNAGKGRRILSKMTAQRAFFRRGEKERPPSLTAPVREKILSFFCYARSDRLVYGCIFPAVRRREMSRQRDVEL